MRVCFDTIFPTASLSEEVGGHVKYAFESTAILMKMRFIIILVLMFKKKKKQAITKFIATKCRTKRVRTRKKITTRTVNVFRYRLVRCNFRPGFKHVSGKPLVTCRWKAK